MKLHKTEEVRTAVLTVVIVVGILSYGVLGYMILEHWNFLDSLYQTVITISTVGFTEVHSLNPYGRIHTMFLILFALSFLGYFLSKFVTLMVEGRINRLLRGRKMGKIISTLKDHFIICGYGKMGKQVAFEFQKSDVQFVVMDRNPDAFLSESAREMLYIAGDATKEEDLERCGIRKARGLVSVLTADQDNVYAILTALGLNSRLQIVARASDDESEKKLKRAGATHVVSPARIGGSRIASMMLRPSITHFLDGLARAEEIRLTLVEIEVTGDSSIKGRSIHDTGITNISESIIVGLRRPGEPMKIRPAIDTRLQVGDQLVIMGQMDAIRRVDQLLKPIM